VYRQGRAGYNIKSNQKHSINSEPRSQSLERSGTRTAEGPFKQKTTSHSRERRKREENYYKDNYLQGNFEE